MLLVEIEGHCKDVAKFKFMNVENRMVTQGKGEKLHQKIISRNMWRPVCYKENLIKHGI